MGIFAPGHGFSSIVSGYVLRCAELHSLRRLPLYPDSVRSSALRGAMGLHHEAREPQEQASVDRPLTSHAYPGCSTRGRRAKAKF